MPLIAQQLGVPETSVSYHESLLSSYFINDPQNSNPPLLMAFYLFVLLLVSVSLILIIHKLVCCFDECPCTSVWHLFQHWGDTGQIPYLSFTGSGDALCTSYIARKFCRNRFDFRGHPSSQYPRRWYCRRHEAAFTYHPLVFAVTILTSFLTVLISAWLPARN